MSVFTQDYAESLLKMKMELDELEVRKGALKRAIAAVEGLVAGSTGATVRSGPASRSDCPDELLTVTVPNRVLRVMKADLDRHWTVSDLYEETFVKDRSAIVNNLQRLKERGRVVQREDTSWGLAPVDAIEGV